MAKKQKNGESTPSDITTGRPLVFGVERALWILIIAVLLAERLINSPSPIGSFGQDEMFAQVEKKSAAGPDCTFSASRRISGAPGTVREINPACISNPYLNINTYESLIPKDTAQRMWEAAVKTNKWSGKSAFGDQYPTHDIGLDGIVDLLSQQDIAYIETAMGTLGSFITEQYVKPRPAVDGQQMRSEGKLVYEQGYPYDTAVQLKGTPFIIKYENNTVPKVHKDNAAISFIVLLSDPSDFDGGGTKFHILNETFQCGQGDALVFSGQLVHEAMRITRGRRFVLSGFTNFAEEFLDMRRKGTLDTMLWHH